MARAGVDFGPSEQEGHDIPTTAKYFSYARSLPSTDGIVRITNNYTTSALQVTANGGSTLTVAPGDANIMGMWFSNSIDQSLTVTTNTSGTARNDLIVVRVQHVDDGFEADFHTIQGTGSAIPSPVNSFGTTWDLPLAVILVPAGTGNVPPANVDDRRFRVGRNPIIMTTGQTSPPSQVGQLQFRSPNRVYQGQPDGSWEQIHPLPDPEWHYFTYSGGEIRDYVAGAGAGYYRGAYAKFPDGTVRLRGLVESASGTAPANVVIDRLPAGFRAGASMVHTAWSSAGAARITIHGDDNATDSGKIRIAGGLASGGWLSVDGIAYWAHS